MRCGRPLAIARNQIVEKVKQQPHSSSRKLDKLHAGLVQKRSKLANRAGIVLLHDNARPHVSFRTCQKLTELYWDILPHPPYSPDIALTDYHLFRSMQNDLDRICFDSFEAIDLYLLGSFCL